jgi:hypothetical protein
MPLCITKNAEDPEFGEIALKGNKKKRKSNITNSTFNLGTVFRVDK